MPSITEAAGLLASLTGFLVGLPHAWRVWQNRHDPVKLSGIALSSQVIALAGNVLWSIYAIGIGSLWVGAPNAVNGPVAILSIVLIRRSQRRTAVDAAAAAAASAAARVPTQRPAPCEEVLAGRVLAEAAA